METGSWKLAPSYRTQRQAGGPTKGRRGGGGNGWVENKGFMSPFKSRTRFGVGVHFFVPQQGFHPTWVWDRPPLDQSPHWMQSSPPAWRATRTLRPPPLLFSACLRRTFIRPQNPHAITPAGLRSVPRTAPLSAMGTAEGRSSWTSLDRSPSSCRLGALPATAGNRDIDLAQSGGEHVHRSGKMGGERRRRALMTSRCLLPRVRLERREEELFDDVARGSRRGAQPLRPGREQRAHARVFPAKRRRALRLRRRSQPRSPERTPPVSPLVRRRARRHLFFLSGHCKPILPSHTYRDVTLCQELEPS